MIDTLFRCHYKRWRSALHQKASYRHAAEAALHAERHLQAAQNDREMQTALDALLTAYAKREKVASREGFRLGFTLAAKLASELHPEM